MSHIRELLIDQLQAYFDSHAERLPAPNDSRPYVRPARSDYDGMSNIELIKWLGLIAQCHVEYMATARPMVQEYWANKRAANP